ncbi:MAG: DapH/DapD/GlmU-related protein [Solobacterium sp.]|nr:DapH/DapD/GlmU-related protein [Solobacterium sp.]
MNIAHVGTIVVNSNARVGKGCWIYPGVNIGANTGGPDDVPIIGDDVFLGPGAKVFGKIQIGDNTSIGANAVVTKSFFDGNQTIAGIPARKISEKNSNETIMRQRKNGKEY